MESGWFYLQVQKPGISAALSENYIFTCLAFEVSSNPMQKEHHVYVGCASGAVFQVNYER